MALEEMLFSIKESFEATKNHLLSQAEYEAGQILAQKKASLEEWKKKEELLWTEKIQRETKNEHLHIDIIMEQQKKKHLYEECLRLFETTMDEVFAALREKKEAYLAFLGLCVRKAARIWQTKELGVFLSEKDSSLLEALQEETSLRLNGSFSRRFSGGVICRYGEEEVDYSFEQIREMMRPEMIQWIYKHIEGENHG
ncbi:MAG: V-type ATP synthase subunit E [Brevinematales bacterium]|nr:V-type ATP synthase subunit E [Brevinematales bacterium]